MPAEAIFPQEYFVYYKGKWCTAGGKDPLFGHVDGFQIGPNTAASAPTAVLREEKLFLGQSKQLNGSSDSIGRN